MAKSWFPPRHGTNLFHLVLFALVLAASSAMDNTTYWTERERIMQMEDLSIMGHATPLTEAEQIANDALMALKKAEMADGFGTLNFPPSRNFMTVVTEIEASEVFQFIARMPKGAALHLHSSSMATVDWVVDELTYWPDFYMCYTEDGKLKLRFTQSPDSSCPWELVSSVRASYPTADDFDRELKGKLSLIRDDPDESFPDAAEAWRVFEEVLDTQRGIVLYRPAYVEYLTETLRIFMEDNASYLEFRGTLTSLYELDGTELSKEEVVTVYRDTVQRFLEANPGSFYGARIIFSPSRHVDTARMWENVETAQRLKGLFPDFFAGFDIVGQEDAGYPLKDHLEPLLSLSEGEIEVPVFYHAGETSWYGMSTDENLIDALLLNTTRIGHGYALTKHPKAKELALEMGVPIEVCPISNQVLKLVDDLRNHPAASLVAEGFPIVVSADDPASWGAKGLSYDFYEAFMALGGARADLRFLKQLAINSIQFSSLEEDKKSELMTLWQEKWDHFIAEFTQQRN